MGWRRYQKSLRQRFVTKAGLRGSSVRLHAHVFTVLATKSRDIYIPTPRRVYRRPGAVLCRTTPPHVSANEKRRIKFAPNKSSGEARKADAHDKIETSGGRARGSA